MSFLAIASTSSFVPLKISLPFFIKTYSPFSMSVFMAPSTEASTGLLGTSLISIPCFSKVSLTTFEKVDKKSWALAKILLRNVKKSSNNGFMFLDFLFKLNRDCH
ncbi:hypothetical protein [Flavobacterium sp. 9AF]|uniref:hypothetical protein n=1 Tax=Flavobacterium sp. 9AF TaxID=2653142 RepID=UPI001F23D64B|nr:hypothetical protein [Flavobacterium sp. 9AF]